jgi:hypothetical protein
VVPEDQRADFETMVHQTDDLSKAIDNWWEQATAKLNEQGRQRIELAANHIRDVIANIPEAARFSEQIHVPDGVSPEVHFEAVKALTNDKIAQDRLDRFIDENLNTNTVHPDTAQGRVLAEIEAELKTMADEVKEHEHMADILESCRV